MCIRDSYMTVHELLQLRNDVNICVFLHASPFSQLHVVRFGFDRGLFLRLRLCGSPELIADGGLFLLLPLLDVFQRRQQFTIAAPVSYTHLDVYKRQVLRRSALSQGMMIQTAVSSET